jgi:hypothetical protein
VKKHFTTFLFYLFAPTAFTFSAYGQLPPIPNVHSDPATNCYALLSRPTATGIAFVGVRLGSDPSCDITPPTALQFITVLITEHGSQQGSVFLVDFGTQATTTVDLPPGIYETYLSSTLFAMPHASNPLLAFAKIGAYQEYSLTFAGQQPTWESETWKHLPRAYALTPHIVNGNALTFGVALHGPTTGVFYEVADDGTYLIVRAQVATSDGNQTTVQLPDVFTFDRVVYVHLIDDATSLASDYRIYDPLAQTAATTPQKEKR